MLVIGAGVEVTYSAEKDPRYGITLINRICFRLDYAGGDTWILTAERIQGPNRPIYIENHI